MDTEKFLISEVRKGPVKKMCETAVNQRKGTEQKESQSTVPLRAVRLQEKQSLMDGGISGQQVVTHVIDLSLINIAVKGAKCRLTPALNFSEKGRLQALP